MSRNHSPLMIVMLVLLLSSWSLLPAQTRTTLDVPPCKVFGGSCGDADGNGLVNISDAVYLVAYIFSDGAEPNPLWTGDCDLSSFVNISDAVYLIDYIFGGEPAPCAEPRGAPPGGTSPWLDCLEYQYDGAGRLLLRHINSAFNCCPEDIFVDVYLGGGIITVVESEVFDSAGPCPCLCLFDLEFMREGVPPGIYTIEVEDLYLFGDEDPLVFTADLSGSTEGNYCVYRYEYPWGEMWKATASERMAEAEKRLEMRPGH